MTTRRRARLSSLARGERERKREDRKTGRQKSEKDRVAVRDREVGKREVWLENPWRPGHPLFSGHRHALAYPASVDFAVARAASGTREPRASRSRPSTFPRRQVHALCSNIVAWYRATAPPRHRAEATARLHFQDRISAGC